jgi:hypothetical protein
LNDDSLDLELMGGPKGFQFFEPSTSATDFTFPAGTFAPATGYSLTLLYVNSNLDSPLSSDYSSQTQVNFTTASVPEPAGLAVFGVAASLAAMLRRRRAIQR